MSSSQIRFVFLADSSLHWVSGDDQKSFQSELGRQYIERAVRSAQMNAWKSQGGGAQSDAEDQSWVPDWELVRRPAEGEPSVIAKGVMAFDVADDGVVYSNGNAVFHVDGDGKKTRLAKVRGARQVAVLV